MSDPQTPKVNEQQDAPNRMAGLHRDENERALLAAKNHHKYTRFVRYMRVLLPLAALAIIMLMIIWPQFDTKNFSRDTVNLDDQPELKKDVQTNRLLTARYEDKDKKGRPYIIEADEAVQQKENPDVIDLVYPKADIKLDDEMSLKIKAKDGYYEQEAQNLFLGGGAYFTRSDGTTLVTNSVYSEFKSGNARTDDAVTIEGPSGTLYAQNGMRIENSGDLIVFKGPATMVIFTKDKIVPNKKIPQNTDSKGAE